MPKNFGALIGEGDFAVDVLQRRAHTMQLLSEALMSQRDFAAAAAELRETCAAMEQLYGPSGTWTEVCHRNLGLALEQTAIRRDRKRLLKGLLFQGPTHTQSEIGAKKISCSVSEFRPLRGSLHL